MEVLVDAAAAEETECTVQSTSASDEVSRDTKERQARAKVLLKFVLTDLKCIKITLEDLVKRGKAAPAELSYGEVFLTLKRLNRVASDVTDSLVIVRDECHPETHPHSRQLYDFVLSDLREFSTLVTPIIEETPTTDLTGPKRRLHDYEARRLIGLVSYLLNFHELDRPHGDLKRKAPNLPPPAAAAIACVPSASRATPTAAPVSTPATAPVSAPAAAPPTKRAKMAADKAPSKTHAKAKK